jgi:glycosyltransferase involved in cell wall biosynthesis
MLREMTRRFDAVEVIDTPRLDAAIRKTGRLSRFGLMLAREPVISDWYGRGIERRLRAIAPDVVVVIAAEPKVATLAGRWPMVVVSDSFFANMLDYYPRYAGLGPRIREAGHRQQRRLLDAGAVMMLSSGWAARTAAAAYDVPVSRFRVAPFGAILEPLEPPPLLREGEPRRLLFVGQDWERKGGDLALETLAILRRRLGEVELDIVGCQPPPRAARAPGVKIHGILKQAEPEAAARLRALFAAASVFFTPSRQEAYGLVFAEACAFGLPSVAIDTGGVGEVVRHGETGLLLPPGALAAEHAAAIERLWADPAAYQAMRRAARRAFDLRLNWRAWGDGLEEALAEAVHGPRAARIEASKPRASG